MLTRVTLIDGWLVSMIPVIEGTKRHQDYGSQVEMLPVAEEVRDVAVEPSG